MNFFERQEQARKKTKLLLVYYTLAVVGTIVAVYFAIVLFFNYQKVEKTGSWWQPELFVWVSSITLLIVGVGSLTKLAQLSSGGGAVAQALGGRPVNPNTTSLEEKRLMNVVSEMAIASGVPVPEVYVLDNEPGINAFAAGHSPKDAAIGVTRGALKLLNRDELQGVIAHEFSHILNGDMRLNLRLIAGIAGILTLTMIGYQILRARVRGKGGGYIKLFGLVLVIIGAIGAFFARLIQAAVSRQREFLADASAVQFTRNPSGIAGALKKIGALEAGSKIHSPAATETAHIFFSQSFSTLLSNLLATHPPLEERIKAIEGSFEGEFKPITTVEPTIETRPEKPGARPVQPPIIGIPAGGRIRTEVIFGLTGSVTPQHLEYSENVKSILPASLVSATEEPYGAVALVYALLLDDKQPIRDKQLTELSKTVRPAIYKETIKIYPQTQAVDRKFKSILIELAIPALRQLSPSQYAEFENAVEVLIRADLHVDLFEFMLTKMIKRRLEPHFKGTPPIEPVINSLKAVLQECSVLFSAMASTGHGDEAEARSAFETGLKKTGLNEVGFEFLPIDKCGISEIDKALDKCAKLHPILRQKLLQAATAIASSDDYLTAYEGELLRIIADSLDCPVPPIIYEDIK